MHAHIGILTHVCPRAPNAHKHGLAQVKFDLAKPVKYASVYALFRGNHQGTVYFTDVTLSSVTPAILTDGSAVVQPDGSVVVHASMGGNVALAVVATFEGLSDSIRVTCTVTRTDRSLLGNASSLDRAVSIGLALPVNATGWHHFADLDSDTVLGPWDAAVGPQYQNDGLPFPTDYYPFLALCSDDVGLAGGVPVDGPVFVSRTE